MHRFRNGQCGFCSSLTRRSRTSSCRDATQLPTPGDHSSRFCRFTCINNGEAMQMGLISIGRTSEMQRILSDELIRPPPSECLSLKRQGSSRLFARRCRYEALAPSDNSIFQVALPEHAGSVAVHTLIGCSCDIGCWPL